MKKLMLLFALAGFFSLNMQAQSCSHAKAANAEKECTASTAKAASAAAEADATIQSRTSATTGAVSFVRTLVNTETGATTFEEVEYCTKSGKFINASPSDKKACTAKGKASCGSAKSTGTKAAGCCTSGAQTGCCSGKKAGAKASAPVMEGQANPEEKGGA